MLNIKVVSTGNYIPAKQVDSTSLDAEFAFEPGTIERKTGIARRYYADEHETAPVMGARAIEAALQNAGLTLDDIDVIVSVSGTIAQMVPCNASLILAELEQGHSRLFAFDINSTCLSFLVGLDTMAHLLASGRYRRAVLVASERGSNCLHPKEFESRSLMGDGAVAVIIEPTPKGERSGVIGSYFETHSQGVRLCEVPGLGTTRPPHGPYKASEEDGYFTMNGPEVFRLASELMPSFFGRFLEQTCSQISDYDHVIPHQASGLAVAFTARRLGVPKEKVFTYLEGYGNLIGASISMGLHFMIEQNRLQRGDKLLLAGTSAGLSLGALALVY